jgi:hypothetical protein
MATPDQLRQFITAQPFVPFMIRMNGGRSFLVRHPENAACDQRGRALAVFDDDGTHLLEMLLVEVIEPATSPADSSGKGA